MSHQLSTISRSVGDFLGRPVWFPFGIQCSCGWVYRWTQQFSDAIRSMGEERGGKILKTEIETKIRWHLHENGVRQ